jgi:phi13 family phage major tail protein
MGYTLLKGVDKLYYALVTQDDVNGYVAGTPKYLAPLQLAVQTPTVNTETSYYDNQPMFNDVAEGETKIKLDITALPLDIQAELLGKVYDATTESLYDNGATPPSIALGFRAKNSDGSYTLFWYYKGNFAAPEESVQTQTNTPDPKGLTVEFTAVRTIYQFALSGSITDSAKRRISTKQADVATWFNAVQVPVNSAAPALTLTPVPADNATGISVSGDITLTFSNQLVTGTNGVVLMKQTDRSLPPATYSINAALKVITIHPTSNLSATTVYYISIADVTDVFGQKLTDTVLKFTTV